MEEKFDIVQLIDKNPIVKLTSSYQSKLINKIKDSFSTEDQQLFIASFYCYLNYKKDDFIIDLDNIWKWLGYTRKLKAKELLEKYFKEDIDFKIVLPRSGENLKGGRPSDKFLLTIKTFKKMCLKANTEKSNEIHEYYIKLEETLHELIDEESNELRLQLQEKDNELQQSQEEIQALTKKYVKPVKQVFEDKNVVYLMTTNEGEKVGNYTIGKATDLKNRKGGYDSNKLHDFKVIYYRSCNSLKLMDVLESVVLTKLGKYRCKAGRDVFLLPKDKDISLFTDVFDKCMKFFEDVEETCIIFPRRTLDIEKQKQENKKYQIEHKEEIIKQRQEYREKNKDKISENGKNYYLENQAEIIRKCKEHYERNKEKIAEKSKEYREKNKEELAEKSKEYREKNKDKISEKGKNYYLENQAEIIRKSKEYQDRNKDKIFVRRKEYRAEHKEEIAEKKKQFYDENKEQILEKHKKYYIEHKDKIIEKSLDYYEKNKGKILEKRKEYYENNKTKRHEKKICECGSEVNCSGMSRHVKTTKHQLFVNSSK